MIKKMTKDIDRTNVRNADRRDFNEIGILRGFVVALGLWTEGMCLYGFIFILTVIRNKLGRVLL